MAAIFLQKFSGEIPRISKKLLPEVNAQSVIDCDLQYGNLRPLKTNLFETTPTKVGTKKTIYRFGGGQWFHWLTDVDVIRGPIAGDTAERTYYTGDGAPKMTYAPIATSGGGTDYPNNSYTLGVPAPTTAVNAAAVDRTGNITGASQANPVVITSVAHGLSSGDQVDISGVGGMVELNGNTYLITKLTNDTFSLQDSTGTDIDGTAFTAYTSGGTWTQSYLAVDLESRVYFYTYVTDLGEEGLPSAASNSVAVGIDQQVDLSNMATGPGSGYNVTKKRIYRSNGGDPLLVAEIVLANTTYSDSILNADLQNVLPNDYAPPPADLSGLTMMPNGVAVGFSKNEVCFSEPFLPHAWPSRYRLSTDYPVVAIAVVATDVIVTTTGNPYIISGIDPESMSMEKVEMLPQACVSKRSMVDMGTFAMYASPDGLVAIGSGTARVITEGVMTRENWQDLNPSSIDGWLWEGRYVGFYDNGTTQGGFIFDPRTNDFSYISEYATAGHNQLQEDKLYLQVGNDIVEFTGGSTNRSMTWRSKIFSIRGQNMSAGQVVSSAYPVTLKLYADGSLKHTQMVNDDNIFRLPGGYRASEWEIELSGINDIDYAIVATSSEEVRRVTQ